MVRTASTTSGTAAVTSRSAREKTLTLVTRLVHLNARAVQFELECRFAKPLQRLSDALCRRCEHRLDRTKDLYRVFRKRRWALHERHSGNLAEIARHHGGVADDRRRRTRRLGDRLGEHALDGALAKLTRQQPREEVLLFRRRTLVEGRQLSLAVLGRAGAGGSCDAFECDDDVNKL